MNCDDFLKLWNARLDDPASVNAAALDEHSGSCADCGRLALGFQWMARGTPPPLPPEGLGDRVLAAWVASEEAPRGLVFPVRWAAWCGGMAAAAAALFAFTMWRPATPKVPTVAVRPVVPSRPWTSALADATSATLDLARETSAPAARVGQEVLISSRPTDSLWPVSISAPTSPTGVLESVSRTVNSGMKPLSGSARRAFSFLSAPQVRPSAPTSGRSGA